MEESGGASQQKRTMESGGSSKRISVVVPNRGEWRRFSTARLDGQQWHITKGNSVEERGWVDIKWLIAVLLG